MALGKDLKQLVTDTPTILAVEEAIDDLPALIEAGEDLIALAAVKTELTALAADATELGTLAAAETALSALATDATALGTLATIETEVSALVADDAGILAASSAVAAGVATATVTYVSAVQYVTDPAPGMQYKTTTITITDGVITAIAAESEWT